MPKIEGRLKTGTLPNMPERKAVKEIEKAAEEYVIARDARMAASKPEKEAKDKLLAAMNKHKLKLYEFEDEDENHFKCEITVEKEKLKVKKGEKDDDESEE
jgi:hypothetical protein